MHKERALIKMYAKCGSMVQAQRVFDSIQKPGVVAWAALLLGYAENGMGHVALELFSRMKSSGCAPDSVTYIAALKSCTSLAVNGRKIDCLERGKRIHQEIGCHLNQYVQNTLIDMYAKCGSMGEACGTFERMQYPDVVSWTSLLLGYAENGEGHLALDLFLRMKASGCAPDAVTYVAVLKACTSLLTKGIAKGECLERGRQIHAEIGCHLNYYVQNSLIDMYAKCGSMVDARRVFDRMHKPGVIAWASLLLGYAENGEGSLALELFSKMKARGCAPDSVTYVAALKACTSLAVNGQKESCLECGRAIHLEIGSHLNHYVQNTLIDMYAKCGSLLEARRVFDAVQKPSVVSWNALILGYAENGEGHAALDLFSVMRARGCAPDSVTYVAALKACALLAVNGDGLAMGREIHLEIGCHSSQYVQSTLIDMYAKCGSMLDARRVFDSIHNPDVVSWTALLVGHAENGEARNALDLFHEMESSGLVPNSITYVAALKACSLAGDLSLGRKLHSAMSEFTSDVVSSLVGLYAKCGSMEEARKVFDLHSTARGVSTWNALLAGYGSFGDRGSVFSLFEAMRDQGFRPDAVTFLCMLLCCSHGGLVEKARQYFATSVQQGITLSVVHFTCMVDVLGRANQLNEAIAVLREMPCNPDAVAWRTLLGACHKWKNVELGRMAFQSLMGVDNRDASAHVLMAHIYGTRSQGTWDEQAKVLETLHYKLVD